MARERYCVFNLTRQSFLSLGVSIADTQWSRLRGLIGRLRLRGDDGLWVVPSQGVHTVGLTFPIDVVYLDANSRVVHLVEHLGPFRAGPLRRQSRSVLELPTRSVFCSNTQVGDQFLICSPEELAAQLSPQAEGNAGGGQVNMSQAGASANKPRSESNGHWGPRLRRWLRMFGERRRARRSPLPGVAAYYWEGGIPEPHDVLNMSESGAYIGATRSWYPGTIVELTLQQKIADLEKRSDWRASVSVSARVVRSGADGIGIQFLYTNPGDRQGVRKFLAAMKAGGARMGQGARKSGGQALIEFALMLPLLFLLIMNLVNFGVFIYAWITVANAARASAQYMVMSHAWYGNQNEAYPDDVRTLALNDAAWLPNRASLQAAVCKNNRGTLEPAGCGGTWGPPTDPEANDYVAAAVDVTYIYQPLIPFWDFPNLGIHLTIPRTAMHRRAVMRMIQ